MALELIAELATAHGGNIDLAKRMIDYAVAGGADTVKTQAYLPDSVNPQDPQAAWLVQSALSEDHHHALKAHAEAQGARYFASVFDEPSANFIAYLCGRFKVASTEVASAFWKRVPHDITRYVSHPWSAEPLTTRNYVDLVTVPLYPTPLEALVCVEWGTGWSDHCIGLSGCLYAAAQGAEVTEVHVSIPGEGRNLIFDKTQDDLKRLKDWLLECQVMRTGVSRTFRNRWVR